MSVPFFTSLDVERLRTIANQIERAVSQGAFQWPTVPATTEKTMLVQAAYLREVADKLPL